jgi:hypothetical protein
VATTDNGWPAAPDLPLRPFIVDGVSFIPGIVDNDNVALVLGYVLEQIAERVERPVVGWCWGFAFRANVNSPNSLSRHSGGIAVDFNAPAHPNGVPASANFTAAEIDEIHQILGEVENAVRWGGDFNGTPDAMHFEINVTPAELPAIAGRLRDRLEDDMPAPKDWDEADWAAFRTNLLPGIAKAVWMYVVRPAKNPKNSPAVTEQTAQAALKKAANQEDPA